MLKFKLYLNLVLSFLLIAGSIPAQALSPTTSALVQKNYLSNGGFENGPVGFKTYKNAAQATPVTGLGGTPATTMTTTTLTPIADKTSALFTHTASNLQGEGVALSFALEPRARAKLLTISGSYQIVSGAYSGGASATDSDVEVYVYDVDAGQLIQPTAYKLDGGVIGQIYTISAQFQSSLASSNYRLIFHNASTTTSAFQLKLDELVVGSQSKTFGTTRGPIGSIISSASGTTPTGYLPANGALVSRTQYSALFLAIGTTYGAGDGSTTFTLPNLSGVFARGAGSQTIGGITYSGTLGSSQIDQMQGHNHSFSPAFVLGNPAGSSSVQSGSTLNYTGLGTSVGNPTNDGSNGNPRTGSETRPANVGVAYYICFDAGTTSAADSGEGRVIAAQIAFSSSDQVIAASGTATLQFNNVLSDSIGFFNPSTYAATVSVSGYYRVSASFRIKNAPTTNDKILILNAGGVGYVLDIVTQSGFAYAKGTTTVKLNAGQTIFMQGVNGDTVNSVTIQGGNGYFTIDRLSANSQILAGESVNARYTSTSGTTIGTGSAAVPFPIKLYDSHNAYNTTTGVYTVPAPGKYSVKVAIATAPVTLATTGFLDVNLFQNSVVVSELGFAAGTGGSQVVRAGGSDTINCLAGDQLQIQANASTTTSVYTGAAYSTRLTIERVGN